MMETVVNTVLPDIPRIYTAIAEWLACLICIIGVKRKINLKVLAGISVGFLVCQSVFLQLTAGAEGIWWIVYMGAAVGFMYFYIAACCDITWKDAGYYCVRAFVIAEFAASLEWQLDCFAYYALGWKTMWIRGGMLILIYTFVFFCVWLCYRKYENAEEPILVTSKELVSCVIIGLAVFLISNLGFVSLTTPFSGGRAAEIFNVRTLVDLGGVAILYAFHVQRVDLRVRHELESMQNILHNQYVQYQQSQEAMDLIHYKYHDLKHHIIALRAQENAQQREAYLDKMEEEIQNFEAQNRTGNEVLDTLLNAKMLLCMKKDISMTCVVDGTLFSFMDTMDICSLFGNALDNAIEYEEKIVEKEKRLIHVTACAQKNFLIVRFENYCEEEMELGKVFPATTKGDTQFHGYGLKSLRYTVRKYGGEVNVNIEDNWFVLKVLIPMKIN